MPKKRKQPRKPTKQGRRNNGRAASGPERAVDSLMAAFNRWLNARQPDVDVPTYEDVARTAVDMKLNRLAEPDPARWDTGLVDTVVGQLMPAKVIADDDYAAATVPAMRAYLTFLKETGRWDDDEGTRRDALWTLDQLEPTMVQRFSGIENKSMGARVLSLAAEEGVDLDDEDQLAAFMDRFNSMPQEWREQATGGPDPMASTTPGSTPGFDVLVLSEQQEAATLLGLPVALQMTELLEWVGASRETTSTGALRLKDIPDVAKRLGIEVPEPSVQSMWQLDDLSELWVAAIETGVLERTATTVRPGPQAGAWRSRTPADAVRVGRALVGNVVLLSVMGSQAGRYPQWLATHLAGMLALVLATATSEGSMDLDDLRAGANEGSTPAGLVGDLVLGLAEQRMDRLVALGILELDGVHARVPAPLRASLIEPLRIIGLEVNPVDRDGAGISWQPSALLSAEAHRDAQAAHANATYQVKVVLEGSRPPIWRRLRLPGSTPLDRLHDLLQTAFGWTNSHLHRFTTDAPYDATVSYEPSRQPRSDLGFGGGPSVVDESTVTLAGLAPGPRDQIMYLYDFGDDWTHSITVESIDAPDPDERLPRCTGGRRRAPLDDSGGVFGWDMLVASALDPTDEDHEDAREWLNLAPGERFDPAEFDRDEVTRALKAFAIP